MSSWVAPLDTRSAALACCGSSRIRAIQRLRLVCAIASWVTGTICAQSTSGTVQGVLRDAAGRPVAGRAILFTGSLGLRAAAHSNGAGEFAITLPYGRYGLAAEVGRGAVPAAVRVYIAPLQTTRLELAIDASGSLRVLRSESRTAGLWTDRTPGRTYPEGFSLSAVLASRDPSSVTEPLDFTGLSDNRLAIESQRALSWTHTQYRLQGMDATDSYQPGRIAALPDIQAFDEVVVRSAFALTASLSPGTEIGLFLRQPEACWHGGFATASTGGIFSWTNLPPPPNNGLVQQSSQFHWLTRDRIETGGPVTKWADLYASAAGQWSSQTEPLLAPVTDQRSRLLYGNVRGRAMAGSRDQFSALFGGSRIDLTDGGLPAGIEAWAGLRMAPSLVLPGGFPGQQETDHLDFLKLSWTHLFSEKHAAGLLQASYAHTVAHLDTSTVRSGQSSVELLGGAIAGAPPLANLAVRPRHELDASWQPASLRAGGTRHRIVAGGAWQSAEPLNRFTAPRDTNLITVDGAPAYAMQFNTPVDSRSLIRSLSVFLGDEMQLTPLLSADAGLAADFSRGSLPAQTSPPGTYASERAFAAQSGLISWNSVSPRVGVALLAPHAHGLVIRGAYFRAYAPLAGRYLDFGNPNSLGGSAFAVSAVNGLPLPGEILARFGGPYSSISPALRRPYADEFDVGADLPLANRSIVSVHLFRRDEKGRIAAVNTGLPLQAFAPVVIGDPGPDGIPGTLDDQRLTVYAQAPAMLGQDRYVLTNPPGLRMQNTGLIAEAGTEWRGLALHASFVAEKSYGPANPGDAFFENDPGVIGTLFMDPNTLINAAGRSFVDRAYVGKVQATYRLPAAWGRIEIASIADYMDGLVFARQLLITGLPQGPFLVAATVRGSPEGGNRAEYVINWNLRASREFVLPLGRLIGIADVLNVTNAAQRLQENDLSGPSFNQRLPVAIQPGRFVRLGFQYEF
jgi:hypothetical protein